MKIKKIYILLLVVIGLSSISIYSTYALLTKEQEVSKANITTDSYTFDLGKEIEYKYVTIYSGNIMDIELNITNSSNNMMNYIVWYQMDNPSTKPDDVIIAYKDKEANGGTLLKDGHVKNNIRITNNSANAISIYIGVSTNTDRRIITDIYGQKEEGIKSFDETTVYDLSGNSFNGTFQEGATVKDDGEGNKGIYFDGINDYVTVPELPDTIDWENGFTIEYEARWEDFNWFGRIYDFGNGPESDNILSASVDDTNTLMFSIRNTNIAYEKYIPDMVELHKKINFKVVYTKESNRFVQEAYKNNKLVDTTIHETENPIRNITRTTNYLGKSNWEDISPDQRFHGYIYSLKITDRNNKVILWYDVNIKN